MIKTMYAVYPHDSVNRSFVLRRMSNGKLVIMGKYADLMCKTCGKVDEKAALFRGIQPEVAVKSKRPFLAAADDFYLLDERAKRVFSCIVPEEIDYYRIPSSSFYVASAKVWWQPREADPGFRFLGMRCNECGRPKNINWGKVPPTIVGLKRIMGVNLETILGAGETWLVSQDVADELKRASPPLTGLHLDPKEVNDGED